MNLLKYVIVASDMAFRYSDGQIYESNFHFWYVNGCKPDPELKVEEVETETRVEGGARITHPMHELSGRLRVRGGEHGPQWCR